MKARSPGFFFIVALVFMFISAISVVLITENTFIFRAGEIRDYHTVRLNLEARSLESYARHELSLLTDSNRISRADNFLQIYGKANQIRWQVSRFPESRGVSTSAVYIKLTPASNPDFEYVFQY